MRAISLEDLVRKNDTLVGYTPKVYVAGPMTGYKDYNYHVFGWLSNALGEHGLEVRNPATYPTYWNDHGDYVAMGLAMLGLCNTIVLLPGWEHSAGSRQEVYLAVEKGMDVLVLPAPLAWQAWCMMDRLSEAYGDFGVLTKEELANEQKESLMSRSGGVLSLGKECKRAEEFYG